MERKRQRRLIHIRPRRCVPLPAKARYGSDLQSASSRRGWLRVLLETTACHAFQCTKLLWRVRQCRRHDECRRKPAVLIPDLEACGEEAEVSTDCIAHCVSEADTRLVDLDEDNKAFTVTKMKRSSIDHRCHSRNPTPSGAPSQRTLGLSKPHCRARETMVCQSVREKSVK